MSPDLLLKLIAIPVALSLVYSMTAAETDQSLSQLAVSVQYEALRDVAGTTYEESFYSADKSEEGLEANINDVSGYSTRVSYFDYAEGADLAREQLIAQLAGDSDNALSILDTSFTEGIDGYIDVLIAGGTLIEEDGSFFENALWGEAGVSAGSYFSGLLGFNSTGDNVTTAYCQPYSQIQKIQARLKTEKSNRSTLSSINKENDVNKKLVDPKNLNPLSPLNSDQSSELEVADLVDAVATAQYSPSVETAIAETDALDECFIAQTKAVFDLEQIAITPIKQMPNLAYYNYFYSTTEDKVNIEDGSASFFLFRNTKPSPEDIERRERLYQTARQTVSKWNVF